MHQLWRVHIGRETLASTKGKQHHQSLVFFKQATYANVNQYLQGDISRGLQHQLWLLHVAQSTPCVDWLHYLWHVHITQL